jgi:hypothetical protein
VCRKIRVLMNVPSHISSPERFRSCRPVLGSMTGVRKPARTAMRSSSFRMSVIMASAPVSNDGNNSVLEDVLTEDCFELRPEWYRPFALLGLEPTPTVPPKRNRAPIERDVIQLKPEDLVVTTPREEIGGHQCMGARSRDGTRVVRRRRQEPGRLQKQGGIMYLQVGRVVVALLRLLQEFGYWVVAEGDNFEFPASPVQT